MQRTTPSVAADAEAVRHATPRVLENIVNDVFVSFPFEPRFDVVFDAIKDVIAKRSLNAIRIDQTSPIARSISAEIQQRIRGARLIVADVTGNNPNVLNEIGQAQAFGKPLVLITQDRPTNAPFNVRDVKLHHYDPVHLSEVRALIDRALTEATSPNEMLRSMLVPSTLGRPTRDSWFVIAASPLSYRRARARKGGYKKLRRTSSDYVGVRGILQSFGLLFGFDTLPDNLDPEDCDDAVLTEPMNMYCIASPKANRWTGDILAELDKRWAPALGFLADPRSPDLRNVRISLYSDGQMVHPPGWDLSDPRDRYARDFGIIVRAPNPHHEDCMVAVVAGRSSLGTEAASIAFTDPDAIQEIRRRLSGLAIDLENHKQPFWAVVSMERMLGNHKEEAIRETLRIERVETFRRK